MDTPWTLFDDIPTKVSIKSSHMFLKNIGYRMKDLRKMPNTEVDLLFQKHIDAGLDYLKINTLKLDYGVKNLNEMSPEDISTMYDKLMAGGITPRQVWRLQQMGLNQDKIDTLDKKQAGAIIGQKILEDQILGDGI